MQYFFLFFSFYGKKTFHTIYYDQAFAIIHLLPDSSHHLSHPAPCPLSLSPSLFGKQTQNTKQESKIYNQKKAETKNLKQYKMRQIAYKNPLSLPFLGQILLDMGTTLKSD